MPIERLGLPENSVDLVVSNYALHHLRDSDKQTAVNEAFKWLRPGGMLVIGDMMFGRGGDARDREIIGSKLALLLRKGPGGWWRIVKNSGRYLFRFQERPVSMSAWAAMFSKAGLIDVQAIPVVNEAAVVRGTKPKPPGNGSQLRETVRVCPTMNSTGRRSSSVKVVMATMVPLRTCKEFDQLGDELGRVDRADSRREVVTPQGRKAPHLLELAVLNERDRVVPLGDVHDPCRP